MQLAAVKLWQPGCRTLRAAEWRRAAALEGECVAHASVEPLLEALHDSLDHSVSRPGMHEADWGSDVCSAACAIGGLGHHKSEGLLLCKAIISTSAIDRMLV